MFARRTKGRVHYNTFNEQQKCHVTNIYTVEEKQKYHITFFCENNKSIILHHVLPNYPQNHFLAAFVILIEESFYLIARKAKLIIMFARRTKGRVHYNTFNEQHVMLQIFTLWRKNKSIILHSFARKTKVSYYITFFQNLLKTFFLWPLL